MALSTPASSFPKRLSSNPIANHPYLSIGSKLPIRVLDPQGLRGLGLHLIVDPAGVLRPEQGYLTVRDGRHQHLFTAVTPIAMHTTISHNTDGSRLERRMKPYIFHTQGLASNYLLTNGTNQAITTEVIINRQRGVVIEAHVYLSEGDYARYWHPLKGENAPVLNDTIRHVPYLTPGLEKLLCTATRTTNSLDAVYVFNKLQHIISGTYFADHNISGIFKYVNKKKHITYSPHRVGPVIAAPSTCGAMCMSDRANTKQWASVFKGEDPLDQNTVVEMCRALMRGGSNTINITGVALAYKKAA